MERKNDSNYAICEAGKGCYLYDRFGRYSPEFPKCSGSCCLTKKEAVHDLIIKIYRTPGDKIDLEKIN